MNRRTRRSDHRTEALQYLIEALARRSDVSSVAVVTEGGHVMAGTGNDEELRALARIAAPAARGETPADFDEVTRGTDFLGRGFLWRGQTLYLAALGSRLRKMQDAITGIARILEHPAVAG